MTLEGLVMLVVWIIVAFVVAAILTWIVHTSPIPDPPKRWVTWGIQAFIGLLLILWLIRHVLGNPRLW